MSKPAKKLREMLLFIETVLICTLTDLIIVIIGDYPNDVGLTDVDLTSSAFQSIFLPCWATF